MVGTERFELSGENSQQNSDQNTSENLKTKNSQLGTQELHQPGHAADKSLIRTAEDKQRPASETTEIPNDLREVVNRWLDLSPAVKQAVLSIVLQAQRNFPAAVGHASAAGKEVTYSNKISV